MIFIARDIDHSKWRIGARDEYWKGVHPCNIHRGGYTTSTGGIEACDEYWTGVHPSTIRREGYSPLHRGYRHTR